MNIYIRGVTLAEISGQARPANFFLYNPARLGINILQKFIQWFKYIFKGGQKLMKIFLSTGIICDLISLQSQTCGFSKQNIIFRILGKF